MCADADIAGVLYRRIGIFLPKHCTDVSRCPDLSACGQLCLEIYTEIAIVLEECLYARLASHGQDIGPITECFRTARVLNGNIPGWLAG